MPRARQPGALCPLWLCSLCSLLVALPAANGQDQHAAIQSTRGVQHKPPLISDDFIVGVIMIMFLLLFAFGARLPRPVRAPPALSTARRFARPAGKQ